MVRVEAASTRLVSRDMLRHRDLPAAEEAGKNYERKIA